MTPRKTIEPRHVALLPENPLSGSTWTVPKDIRAFDGRLVWALDAQTTVAKREPGLLGRFVELANSKDSEILEFARRWGVLDLCEHLVPRGFPHTDPTGSHKTSLLRLPEVAAPPKGYERPIPELPCFYRVLTEVVPDRARKPLERRWNLDFVWEPMAAWRFFSLQARTIWNLAGRIHQDERTSIEDWTSIYPEDYIGIDLLRRTRRVGGQSASSRLSSEEQRRLLAGALNAWLRWGQVHPEWQWVGDKPSIRYAGVGLFGVLAVGLMLSVNKDREHATCTHCGMGFAPERSRVIGLRMFCDSCRHEGVGVNYANKDSRKRKTLVLNMLKEGKTDEEIKRAVKGGRSGKVKEWIDKAVERDPTLRG